MRELIIDGVRVADDETAYVIAEIGHNHQGKVQNAQALITECALAGADAVKFQKRDNATIYTGALLAQPYDNEHSYGKTYGAHREALEFDAEQYRRCYQTAEEHEITAFATAFDERSADFLMALDTPALKIASGDLTNTPLLAYLSGLGVPLILSTGGGTVEDISRAVDIITKRTSQLAILHCTAAYPVHNWAELNLRCIVTLREQFPDFVIGWSGHDNGIAMAVMAYTLGARILEKHVTLNRALKGTDHAFSLEPQGLRKMIRDLDRAHQALGDGVKVRYASENGPLRKMAKCLVATRSLPAGHVLTRDDLTRKSPADGIPPYEWESVVGFPLTLPIGADEPLTYDHLRAAHDVAAS